MIRLQLLQKYTNTFFKFLSSRSLSTSVTSNPKELEYSVSLKSCTGPPLLLQQNIFGNDLNAVSSGFNSSLYKTPVSVLNIFRSSAIGNSQLKLPTNSMINEHNFPYIYEKDLLKLPPVKNIKDTEKNEPLNHIEAPAQNDVTEKQAARLIVIRRRKMKKHKLKKLRIKMKYEWAKVRQRREMRKEKKFQAKLISQIKEAEKFSAEQYVAERLKEYNRLMSKH